MDGPEISDGRSATVREFVEIQLTHEDRTGILEPADDLGVFTGDTIFEQLAGARGANTCGIDVVLQRDRDTVKWTSPVAALEFRIQHAGVGQRLFGSNRDEGVQQRLQSLNARQAGASEVNRGHRPGANQVGCFPDGHAGQVRRFGESECGNGAETCRKKASAIHFQPSPIRKSSTG